MIEHTSTGKCRRIFPAGRKITVCVSVRETGEIRAFFKTDDEHRRVGMPLKMRRISPFEAQAIKATIKKLLKEI